MHVYSDALYRMKFLDDMMRLGQVFSKSVMLMYYLIQPLKTVALTTASH
jgi:hypothetical protein